MLEQILAKIEQKGWKVYAVDIDCHGYEHPLIEQGPVQEMKSGTFYTLFPRSRDFRNRQQLYQEKERLEKRLIRPQIQFQGGWWKLDPIYVNKQTLDIMYPNELCLNYQEFYDCLESLPNTSLPN